MNRDDEKEDEKIVRTSPVFGPDCRRAVALGVMVLATKCALKWQLSLLLPPRNGLVTKETVCHSILRDKICLLFSQQAFVAKCDTIASHTTTVNKHHNKKPSKILFITHTLRLLPANFPKIAQSLRKR